jgi:hypothetical protein
MVRKRLSPALFILTLVLGACTSRTVPTPTIVQTGILGGVKPTATITRIPSLTHTSQPSLGEPTTTRAPAELPNSGQPHPTETYSGEFGEPAGPATVSGKICPPDEDSAALTAYFENIETFKLATLSIAMDQSNYSLEVDPGQYLAYAYPNAPGASGGLYSEAVPGGLLPPAQHVALPVPPRRADDRRNDGCAAGRGRPGPAPRLRAGVSGCLAWG